MQMLTRLVICSLSFALMAQTTLAAGKRDCKGIYTDPVTNLQWTRNANIAGKAMSWDEATRWVRSLKIGGHQDWRMPTKDELESFAMRGGQRPAEWFNMNGFCNVEEYLYWTSSTIGDHAAWYVSMIHGHAFGYSKSDDDYIWPVRSGQ